MRSIWRIWCFEASEDQKLERPRIDKERIERLRGIAAGIIFAAAMGHSWGGSALCCGIAAGSRRRKERHETLFFDSGRTFEINLCPTLMRGAFV